MTFSGVDDTEIAPAPPLHRALALLLGVWTALLGGAALAPLVGTPAATLGAFAAAAGLVGLVPVAGRRAPPLAHAAAFACGLVSHAAWTAAVAPLGLALGLAPRPEAASAAADGAAWLAVVGLAPWFEERLHRGVLLPALGERLGAAPALLATSTLFALPHAEAWSALGAGCVGLALGAVFLATRAVGLCVALHAGLNAAALAASAGAAADPLASALLGCLLLAAVLALARPAPEAKVPPGDARWIPLAGSPGATARAPRSRLRSS